MSEHIDPRTEHKWKQTRYEQRVELLLGAILDALKDKHVPVKAPKAKAEPKVEKA